MKTLKKSMAVLAVSAFTLLSSPVAQAAPGDSIALYFSAPFVNGSHIVEGAVTENFNGYAAGAQVGAEVACPTTIPGFATLTFAPGSCLIGIQAGTNAGSQEQAVATPLSSFVTRTLNTTFTFTNPVKYVGFWWMMGSAGNTVEFLGAGDELVATFDSADVIDVLGANSLVSNTDTRTITTLEGGTHLRKHFYRSPANYTGTVAAPVMDYNVNSFANEPWVYLNLFVSGSIEITKVRFKGSNFEMDNLTVSTTESLPKGNFAPALNILGTPPALQTLDWNPTNTEVTETNPEHTPSAAALVTSPATGGGAITYAVLDAGDSGCTVDAQTGVITYTGIGSCVIRAKAAAVPGQYYEATKDVTFNFTSAPDEPTEEPVDEENGNESETGGSLADTGSEVSMSSLYAALALLLLGLALVRVATRKARS
jgi:hypothetical protein